ncbi:AraC family transcriptional regulator [Pullulanibacillus camelliae]|uniref:AraC family transcriptional regulator n=1 Tax=Pullulanibacillus camelliae TaxID=1707096 RepID=A0A8J3DVQ3_9BACL|nr:response regulator [Pullulanibacillus camelliae]GGE45023.1 AraC family transcriptional regulator [Pullulanibacillus camelliae]
MKLKLVIVDDESIEREALRKMIEDSLPALTVVGEAANGRQAIEQAQALLPDIIMMDIKMPGIDGVEAVKQIRRHLPDVKFIMVSAYNTFDYAKQVMREGVKEYLLKPSRRTEILETIQRVAQEIQQERKSEQENEAIRDSYKKALSFVQSEWVSALLFDHIQEVSNEEWESVFNPEEQEIYAMVIRVNAPDTSEAQPLKKQIYKAIKQWFQHGNRGYAGPMADSQIPVLVLGQSALEYSSQSHAIHLARVLIRELDKTFANPLINIGIGTPVNSAKAYVDSYNEALVALEETNENVRYLYYHQLLGNKEKGMEDAAEYEQQLMTAVKNGQVEEIMTAFHSYFTLLSESYHRDVKQVKESLWEMWVVLSRMLKDMGVSIEIKKSSATTLQRLRESAQARLLKVAEEIAHWQTHDLEGVLFQARTYIESHYDQSISLEDVANQVQLSPYYFSKLFKEHFGMTYIDYLTKIRIEKAKVLMRTTNKSQKEICFEVGYRDPNYFSRVFKKWTNLSPTGYRQEEVGTKEL